MDKLRKLYDSYKEQGLISEETSFEQFSSADDTIKDNLYKSGVENKVISGSTDFDTFNSAWQLDEPEKVKTEAVATEAAPVTAEETVAMPSRTEMISGVKPEDMVSTSEDTSLDAPEYKPIDRTTDQALFNYEQRTGNKASSIMDLTDEDFDPLPVEVRAFKEPDNTDVFKRNRTRIKQLEEERGKVQRRAEIFSYEEMGATPESVAYVEKTMNDFDKETLLEVSRMEDNEEFKLRNDAINQLSRDSNNTRAVGDVSDTTRELSILNVFKGKSYYKDLESKEVIQLNSEVEEAVIDSLDNRELQKLAGGFYTLQEKENIINSVKIPLIKKKEKEVYSSIEKFTNETEAKVNDFSKDINKISGLMRSVLKGKPKNEEGKYMLSEEEINTYEVLEKRYNSIKEEVDSTVKNYESYKKDALNKFNSYQGEMGVDLAKQTISNNFQLSDDADAFREKYAGEGFWNASKDIVGGEVVQGLYKVFKKGSVGATSWALSSFGDLFQDQENYSSFDAFRDVIGNWTDNTMVPSSTDEKFRITKEEGGFKDFDARSYTKLGASMVPFTGYLISEVRKGNYTGLKDALGKTYMNLGAKGKVIPKASQKLKDGIIMADAAFRATVMDNQKQAESLGLKGIQSVAYATAISSTEALVANIMPDTQFLKGVSGKAIKDAFTGSLKKAANKEAIKSAVKEFSTGVLKEYAEEEITLGANLMTDASFGLALPKSSEFLNQQIELTMGTLMLSGSMGSVGATKTFGNQKKLVYDQIGLNASSLELHLSTMYSKVEDIETKDKIKDAIVFARDIKKAIDSSPENVTADQIDLLVEKSKLLDKRKNSDSSFFEEIDTKISGIDEKIKEGGIKRDVLAQIDKDIANVGKSAESYGVKLDETKIFEDDVESSASDKFYDFLLKNKPPKNKQKAEDYANENKNNLGGFVTTADGKEILVINKAAAIKNSVVTTGQHEFLHKLIKHSFGNNSSSVEKAANLLDSFINKMPEGQGLELKSRLDQYREDFNEKKISADNFYNEFMPLFSEAISKKDVELNENFLTKTKDYFRRFFQNSGFSKINFDKNEESIVNFVKDYNKAFSKGNISSKLNITSENKSSKIDGPSSNFSKLSDLKAELQEMDEFDYDNEFEFEQAVSSLESRIKRLEKSEKASSEKEVVAKPKAKEVVESTKEVVEKASNEVFEKPEVSDKNKQIAKTNEDIVNEMSELGVNSVSEIKDPAKKKAIIDKLGRNNLGAVTELTKKAAAIGKDLIIDDNLKVSYDEFFSGFSEELASLIRTYKVDVDGKKVPFGAYMNKNLRLRYGQILNKALQGRVQGAASLDAESGSVGSVKEIAAEGSRDFDAYTSADKGLPAGELIDVTSFRSVKDKVDAVRDAVNLEGVDVADLTYKKVVDDYAGPAGAEIIGLHDKNAQPEKGQDKNNFQKLAERIDGTRTLNYGKGINGEAEVRAMQKLFIDYNDMLKFIKTIPEFNVAPFETTIDKQGRSIDLTTDARGYSVGTSNVLLKQLYDVYVDPKSKSTDKAVKGRSITSPSGRGKGKTSQVSKVYRLKDKYRGRIDRKAVKELQKIIGITEAGEAFIPMKGVNRTLFGTALQGLTKIYAANAANTIIRKDIVDKGITSDKKSTEKVLADIGGGKSSVMFSKAAELGLNTPFDTPELGQVLFSKKARANYEEVLRNKRPDLKDIKGQVDELIKWGDSLDIKDDKKAKYKKLGLFYMANGFVIMPEDGYKVAEAIRLGAANKVDPYSVKNPNELIEKYQAKTKGERLNPDKVKQFSNKTVLKEGVVVYDVEDSKKGQLAVRKAIDTNWGEKANPWCLAARAEPGDKALDKSFELWNSYNEDSNGYKIAFQNGKLMSLRDGNDKSWWDRMDAPSSSIPLKSTVKKEGSQKVTEYRQMDAVNGEGYVSKRTIERPTENGTFSETYTANYETRKLAILERLEVERIEENVTRTTGTEYDNGLEINKNTTTVNEDRDTYISIEEDKMYDKKGSLDYYYKNTSIKGKEFFEKNVEEIRNGKVIKRIQIVKTIESFNEDDTNVVYSHIENDGKVVEDIDNREEFGYEEGGGEYDVLFSKNDNTDLMFNAEDKIPVGRRKEFNSLKQKSGVKTLDILSYINKIPSKDFEGGLKEKRAAMFDVVSDIIIREGVDAGSIALNELKKIRSVFKYEYVNAGFLNSMTDLKSKVKNSTPEESEQLVLDFLRFISRSARTSKGKNLQYVSTNKKIFNEAIVNVLGIKNNFSLEQVKITEKGKPKYVNVIKFKGKRLKGFTDITVIKKYGLSEKINEQADLARTVVLNKLDALKYRLKTDTNFTKEMFDTQLEAFLSLASLDQRGLIRKMSKTNAQIKPGLLKATDLYLEHKMSALEITEKLKEYANEEISIEELQKILEEEALVNLMPKSLAKALPNFRKQRSRNPNYKNSDGYKTEKYLNKLKELNLSIVDIDGNAATASGDRVVFSKNLNETFNKIIENKKGILAGETISEVKAKLMADSKRRFNIFVPPSAEDFVGLLYATLGKGKVGDKQMDFYKKALLKPYARAMEAIRRDRLDLGRAFTEIKKEFNTTPKDLKKKLPDSLFNKEQAVRVFIWDSVGKEVPGLSKAETKELVDYVSNDPKLKEFAEQVTRLNPGSRYTSPSETWSTGNITTDLLETMNESRRAKHLGRWQQNADAIFTKDNLNKLEAAYGTSYRKAMENILTRMKTGRNRTYGSDSQTSKWIDWVNGSVGAIMFFNARSSVLQTLSATNFINFGDNNIFAASKAFANQKQYWSDFARLINSEFLLDRRDSLKINVNEADIAEAASKNGIRGAINYILKLGFTPTKFADSFAIAVGGSTFYRNRINALIKKGMDPVAAEKVAMRDFIETAEESQQSSRPDKISQEQAGSLGRIVLAFANTPAQYTRIIKKAASDLKNRRGSDRENISKIVYYGMAQNLIFNTLQQALFAIAFGDEEEKDLLDEKKLNIVNGMLDSFMRGAGVGGAVLSTVKNAALRIYKETQKDRPKYENVATEVLKISPPISSKIGKIVSAGKTVSWDMKEIKEKGFDITNPAVKAGAQVITAGTNLPLDRVVKKVENLAAASNEELETYKRIALMLGWSKWELGIKDPKKKKTKKKGRNTTTRRTVTRKTIIR